MRKITILSLLTILLNWSFVGACDGGDLSVSKKVFLEVVQAQDGKIVFKALNETSKSVSILVPGSSWGDAAFSVGVLHDDHSFRLFTCDISKASYTVNIARFVEIPPKGEVTLTLVVGGISWEKAVRKLKFGKNKRVYVLYNAKGLLSEKEISRNFFLDALSSKGKKNNSTKAPQKPRAKK